MTSTTDTVLTLGRPHGVEQSVARQNTRLYHLQRLTENACDGRRRVSGRLMRKYKKHTFQRKFLTPQGTGNDLAKLFAFALFHQY